MNPFVNDKQVSLEATGNNLVRRLKSVWFVIMKVSLSYSAFLLVIRSLSIKINVPTF